MVYVRGQECPWIDSPVRITLMGGLGQHPKESNVKKINIHSKKLQKKTVRGKYVYHIQKYLAKSEKKIMLQSIKRCSHLVIKCNSVLKGLNCSSFDEPKGRWIYRWLPRPKLQKGMFCSLKEQWEKKANLSRRYLHFMCERAGSQIRERHNSPSSSPTPIPLATCLLGSHWYC